jgi:phosphate transport system substrate-binding protein
MLKKILCAGVLVASVGSNALASEQIRAVGSSTVYPFVTVAAEEFGRSGKFKTPIVESTGTGGGFKLFCEGVGDDSADIANASRAIKSSEIELCTKNGVNDITEIKIGYDGIVIANVVGENKFELNKAQVFQALAKEIPVDGKLVANTNKKWSDIDASFPDTKIEVYGPPPTSGTRDAFVELVMQKACVDLPEFKVAYADTKELEKACHAIREDGAYVEAGENDNLIVQKLTGNKDAVGIFGYSFLEENSSTLQGHKIDGVEPTFENISSGAYPASRPLFVYVKNAHFKTTTGLKEFAQELISEKAIGQEGYLVEKGLIPLTAEEFATVSKVLDNN